METTVESKPASLRRQFVFLLVSRGLGSGLQAVLVVIFARLAGVENMGLVAIATGSMSMLLSFAEFGMGPLLSKSRALGDERLVNAIVMANLVSSLTIGAVGFGALFWYLESHSLPLVVAGLAVSVALEKNTDVFLNIPIADGNKWIPAWSIVLRRMTNLVAFMAFFYTDHSALLSYVFAIITGAFAGQVHVWFFRGRRDLEAGRATIGQLFKMAIPYSLSNIAAQSRTLDSLVVGAVATVSVAGLYSAAMRLTNPLSLIASSLTSVVMPHAAREGGAYAAKLGRRLVLLAGGSLILILPIAIVAEPIIVILLGDDYSLAAGALVGGLLALPFLSLAPPLGSILQSQGHQKFVAINGLVFAVVTLVFIGFGAGLWGGTGAALGLAASFASKCFSLWLRLRFLSSVISTMPSKED